MVDIPVALVRHLVDSQFPQWAGLPLRPVSLSGWDNRTFHLGDAMSVRLPSAEHYAGQVEKEHAWLPRLAPQLPLPIPAPIAKGAPDDTYPWPWSVYRWLPGEPAAITPPADPVAFARSLAAFLTALYAIDATGGPAPGQHNFWRGASPEVYDAQTRQAIALLAGQIDTERATRLWDEALSSRWQGAPVWFHGDVASGNLLVENGALSAVIDFGTSGVGDPACDLSAAWTLFDGDARAAFRRALPLDAETWARGRGWTLWKALIVTAGISETAPHEVAKARRVLLDVLADPA